MGALDGRVAVITGAGRGIGRAHALLFAKEGARVVVNDLGTAVDGTGTDAGPANDVVAEIRDAGGEAVANTDDVSDFAGARRLIEQAVETFGDLHALVNNAGIVSERMLTDMTEAEWDDIVRVHLKGHFAPLRFAASYWRARSEAGEAVDAAVVNTSSGAGLFHRPGQTGYGSAKAGIASLALIAQEELDRYGVRVNAIAPAAYTRMAAAVLGPLPPRTIGEGSPRDPANISPFVAYLCTAGCPIKGRVFYVRAGEIYLFQPFTIVDEIHTSGRWTVEELQGRAARLADVAFDLHRPAPLDG